MEDSLTVPLTRAQQRELQRAHFNTSTSSAEAVFHHVAIRSNTTAAQPKAALSSNKADKAARHHFSFSPKDEGMEEGRWTWLRHLRKASPALHVFSWERPRRLQAWPRGADPSLAGRQHVLLETEHRSVPSLFPGKWIWFGGLRRVSLGAPHQLKASVRAEEKKLSAFSAQTCSLCFSPFCGGFPQRWRPVNVQSDDPCREDGVLRWPAKSSPAAVLCFLLDKLMCSERALGACTKQRPEHANERFRRTGWGWGWGQGGRREENVPPKPKARWLPFPARSGATCMYHYGNEAFGMLLLFFPKFRAKLNS